MSQIWKGECQKEEIKYKKGLDLSDHYALMEWDQKSSLLWIVSWCICLC